MLLKRKHIGAAGALVAGITLLLSGGVPQAAENNLIVDREFKVSPPEMLEVTQPQMLKVTEPEMLEVSKPDSLGVSEPKSLESGRFPKGEYQPADRDNPAYNRCAKLKTFNEQKQCALEALGITQE